MRQVLYKILFAFSLGLILPQIVFAAQISFDAKTTQTQVGKNFEVILFVNTEQENLNAFEGKVTFPNALLDLKEIRDGNTIVNFWIEKPKAQDNAIIFSGVTPGGFNGSSGLIFSAIFEAKKEGVAKFEVNDARILRNDGIGSTAVLSITPFEMVISKGAQVEIPAIQKIEDREQPELFMPEIARDKSISDGEWFIAFVTQDKVSGIDHYEIKESRQKILTFFSRWRVAESPYILQDQELRSYIFIKAVDKAGNERIAEILPQNPLRWYENYENWIILIVIAVIFASGAKKILWRKRGARI